MTDQTAALTGLDAEAAEWPRALAGTGPRQEEALAQLQGLLVRIAQREVRRRSPRLRITGPELDDLAHQAAADALVALTGKLGQFRGECRFTTWAYKFVMFEVSRRAPRSPQAASSSTARSSPSPRPDAPDCTRLVTQGPPDHALRWPLNRHTRRTGNHEPAPSAPWAPKAALRYLAAARYLVPGGHFCVGAGLPGLSGRDIPCLVFSQTASVFSRIEIDFGGSGVDGWVNKPFVIGAARRVARGGPYSTCWRRSSARP